METLLVYSWVKRLGQEHLFFSRESNTLCGRAMLGNNYVKVIPVEERKRCKQCEEKRRRLGAIWK